VACERTRANEDSARRRLAAASTAVAIALLATAVAIAAAGCGLGPGDPVGDVELRVTRDYGASTMLDRAVGDVSESDTVMRVLEGGADVSTRYGGGFVQSIDGLEAEERFGRSEDWFFYVNGVESTVGAADYPLRGGEAVWWDYHDWSEAMRVPAVVGAWPQPFLDGYDGRRRPVVVECLGGGAACAEVGGSLSRAGVSPALGEPEGAIRVLVGPWARVREDPAAAQVEDGPRTSGVFADVRSEPGGFVLEGLDEEGEVGRAFGRDAGLVAAVRRGEAPPVWLVTGTSEAGAEAAAELLGADRLGGHFAVAVEAGEEAPLPLR
jgi:hypothetical protein